MSIRLALTLAIAVGCVAALVPQPAQACACCGSYQTVEIVGWSASGRTVAIRRMTEATCERREVLEIWKAGERAPTECYDAYAPDPSAPGSCNAEGVDPNGAVVPEPSPLAAPGFDRAAASVAERYLMAWRHHDDETQSDDLTVAVHLPSKSGSGFRDIDTSSYDAEARQDTSIESVSLWPAPRGRNAVMLVRQNRYDDDIEVAVVWVKLPRGFARTVLASGAETIVPQLPPEAPDPDDDDDQRHAAARLLARARVFERIGDQESAHALCRQAAEAEARWTTAWIELARLLVLRQRPERGLAILQRVGALDCSECSVELRAALSNPHFDPIRDDPAFAALGGQP